MKKLSTLVFGMLAGLFLTFQAQGQVTFFINSPSGIAGQIGIIGNTAAGFGGDLGIGQSLTGDLAISLTANTDSLGKWQACESLVNPSEVAGKIAIARRGNCFFSDKVWFAQEAGAIGVIICNNAPGGGVIDMGSGGDYAGLATIPAVMLTYEDCETIIAEINDGETVNVTFEGPVPFYGVALSYSYHTPISQVIPMDLIRARMLNTTGADLINSVYTCDIEDPDGDVTSLETTFPFIAAGADSLIFFPDYIPSKVGLHTATLTNSITSDVLTETFVITDDIFATDRGGALFGASNQGTFETGGYAYHYGSLYLTGANPAIATHISFGLANAAEIFTGNSEYDVVNVVLYNGDDDGDGNLDFSAPTGSASFDDLTPIAFGAYTITGEEGTTELLTADLFSLSGLPVVQLDTAGTYYAVIKYDGDATAAPATPAFLSSNDVEYQGFIACLYLGTGNFFNGGWNGAITVSRLHIDATVNTEDNLNALDQSQARVFPNPASEYVNLELDLKSLAQEVRLDIINYDGKVMGSHKLQNVQKDTFNFSVAHLPAGMYFFSVKTPEGYRSIPFTVVR